MCKFSGLAFIAILDCNVADYNGCHVFYSTQNPYLNKLYVLFEDAFQN